MSDVRAMERRELHKDAQRIVNGIEKTVKPGSTGYIVKNPEAFLFGLKEPYELACAYLAEHAADGEQALDLAFADTLSRRQSSDLHFVWVLGSTDHNQAITLVYDRVTPTREPWTIECGGVRLLYPTTRGSVRRLAAALGIELKGEQ